MKRLFERVYVRLLLMGSASNSDTTMGERYGEGVVRAKGAMAGGLTHRPGWGRSILQLERGIHRASTICCFRTPGTASCYIRGFDVAAPLRRFFKKQRDGNAHAAPGTKPCARSGCAAGDKCGCRPRRSGYRSPENRGRIT